MELHGAGEIGIFKKLNLDKSIGMSNWLKIIDINLHFFLENAFNILLLCI